MNVEIARAVLGWCTVINCGILLFWAVFTMVSRDWQSRLHGKFYGLSVEQFNALNWVAMVLFKMGIILFNLVPYIALRIVA